ncbi:class D sortase [Bacillus benzoevorans]|uniref:Sortase A n=1 Tax=Bacillus benzoevorans TaxID=1456 RepID=A0A7X0HVK4_9BACI|nr:class D sortase [Bacillus benzoevorans]MBB6447653.1 sortase A [Bacillus benzoevorans]
MKKLGNLFLIIGIAIFLFVAYAKVQTYLEQKRMMEEYTQLNLADNPDDASTEVKKGETIGMLEIDKIGLKTAMVEGADQNNIKFAVGHLPFSASLYELGKENHNFVIVGHRSYTFGKFFNRLDEVENDDKIVVYARNKVLTYQVFDKKIVQPTNVDVVNPIKGKSVVTLITCYPEYSDAQRLVLFSELVEEKTLDGSEFAALLKN